MSWRKPHHPLALALVLLLMGPGWLLTPATATAQGEADGDIHRDRTRIEIEHDRGDAQRDTDREIPVEEEIVQQRDTDVDVRVQRTQVEDNRPHWMYTVGRNAVWGGLVGGLVGVGVYLITGFDLSPWIIAQVAGGGILVGAATGVVEAFIAPDTFAFEPTSSAKWVQQQMPEAFQLRLLDLDF